MLGGTRRPLEAPSLDQRNVHIGLSDIDRAYPLIDSRDPSVLGNLFSAHIS
jgi:hypothetical protein